MTKLEKTQEKLRDSHTYSRKVYSGINFEKNFGRDFREK